MVIFVFITIFILYWFVAFISILKTEAFSLLGLFMDIIVLVLLLVYYFIGDHLYNNDLKNFIMFMHFGSFTYMYFAIKFFWIKPKVLIYLVNKDANPEDESLEEQEIDIQTSRVSALYYFIISIVLFIITKIRLTPDIKEDSLSMNPMFIFIGMIITIIWFIIDCYRKKKYRIFLFKTIVPLVVTLWIIIVTLILQ